jgi:formate hydrogenlyase subunit 3/multisubunit Na+/H+ antiporter MnhD subunit
VWCAGLALVTNGLAALALAEVGPVAAAAFAGLVASSVVFTPITVLGMAGALKGRGSLALADFAGARSTWGPRAALALAGVWGLLGAPPLAGFGGRVWLVDALLSSQTDRLALLVVVLLAVALLPATLWRLAGGARAGTGLVGPPRPSLAAPLGLLALVGVLVALGIPPLERVAGATGAGPASGWRGLVATALVGLALALGAVAPLTRAGRAPSQVWAIVIRADKRLRSPGGRLAASLTRADWLTLDLARPIDAVVRPLARATAFGFEAILGRLGRS